MMIGLNKCISRTWLYSTDHDAQCMHAFNSMHVRTISQNKPNWMLHPSQSPTEKMYMLYQSSTVRDFTCTICTYVRTHGVIPIDTRSSPCVRTDTLTKLTIHGYDRCIYVVPRPNLSHISRLTVALVHSKKLIKVRQKKRSTIVQS